MTAEQIIGEMTLEEKASLLSGHDFWTSKAIPRLGIPAVMMCDGPHGLRKQVGEGDHLGINESIQTVCYPSAAALACSFDREALAALGASLGQECQAEHVGMLLGPGVNMKRSPLCGRNFEYFSEDPYLAGELGAAYIRALQAQGVSACVKHYAANSQETRRMSSSSDMDERTLHEIYLPAFEAAVKQGGARAVMCAYNAINGTYLAENKTLLTDILRDKWGYRGMVVTDWGAVKDRVKGLRAGLDLEMPGGAGCQDADIVEAVQSGKLDESIVDAAARNVLQWVLDDAAARTDNAVIDRTVCAELSGKLSAQSAVLLKNEDGILPLSAQSAVALLGEFADAPRYQGAGSSHINVAHVVSACEAAKRRGLPCTYARGYDTHSAGEQEDAALLSEAVEAARSAEVAVVFAGLPDAAETEGADRTTLELPANQNALIEAVAQANPRTIVVLHQGAPVTLPWLDRVKGLLTLYLGGQQVGEAAVRLLWGEENPSGRLAETWPLRLEDTPAFLNFPDERGVVRYCERVYIGYRWYDKKKLDVRFPFGFGLSYTDFRYGDLTLSQTDMADTDTLTVSCRVRNTGSRAGAEVVQLYVGDVESSVGRPVRELRSFEKVALAPGQETTVAFALSRRDFAYYETEIHDWHVETGAFRIEIGASSRDIRLTETVTVTAARALPVVLTEGSTIGEIMQTEKGRAFVQRMMASSASHAGGGAEQTAHMGEAAAVAMRDTMMGMPLISLVTFGRMTRAQLRDLLTELNA